jgi:hypothetical protein
MYQKLKEAYRKGQHSKHFDITGEELHWLRGRIQVLGELVHKVCSEHIAKLKIDAETAEKTNSAT